MNLDADISQTAGANAGSKLALLNKVNAGVTLSQAAGAGLKEATGFEFDPVGLGIAGGYNAYHAMAPEGDEWWQDNGERMNYPIGYEEGNYNKRGGQISKTIKGGMAKAYKAVTGNDYWDSGASYVGNFLADVAGAGAGISGTGANMLTSGGYDAVTGPMLKAAGVDIDAAGIDTDPYNIKKLMATRSGYGDMTMPVADMPEWDDNMASQNVAIEPTAGRTRPDSGIGMQEKMASFDAEQKEYQDYAKRFGNTGGGDIASKMLGAYIAKNQPWRPDFQLPRDHPLVAGLSEDERDVLSNTPRKNVTRGLEIANEMYQQALSQGNPKEIEYARSEIAKYQKLKNFHTESDKFLKSDYEKRRKEQKLRKTKN